MEMERGWSWSWSWSFTFLFGGQEGKIGEGKARQGEARRGNKRREERVREEGTCFFERERGEEGSGEEEEANERGEERRVLNKLNLYTFSTLCRIILVWQFVFSSCSFVVCPWP